MAELIKKKNYKYPGFNDSVFNKLVANTEPYPGYWHLSEEYVFSFADKLLNSNNFANFLDLGCGEGRLTKRFSKYFKNVDAVDPDLERIKAAELLNKPNKDINFHCFKVDETKFPKQHFDVVLLSHVIQHIDTFEIEGLLQNVYESLKSNGILILTTSHSQKSYDKFLNTWESNGNFKTNEISEETFNLNVINNKGILPVHLFSIGALRKYLYNFEICETKVFHISNFPPYFDKIIFRDKLINNFLPKMLFGTDVLLILRKK